MAGLGSRFKNAGYDLPKPLIDVAGKTMIQRIVENIDIDGNYIFIVQKEHSKKYDLKNFLRKFIDCEIIETDGLTEGAACSVLLADEYLYDDCPLLICDSDSLIKWNSKKFIESCSNYDGCVVTFHSNEPHYSYAKVNFGLVEQIAEKQVISKNAIAGRYYWKHSSDFLHYAKWMITKNLRINNEFYVAPVYNYAIEDGKKVINFEADCFYNLGTPESLKIFLALEEDKSKFY